MRFPPSPAPAAVAVAAAAPVACLAGASINVLVVRTRWSVARVESLRDVVKTGQERTFVPEVVSKMFPRLSSPVDDASPLLDTPCNGIAPIHGALQVPERSSPLHDDEQGCTNLRRLLSEYPAWQSE